MTRFVMSRGKKNCGRVKSIHIPRARVEQWALVFQVELCKVYHQYKVIWDAQVGEQLQCRREMGNLP